MLQFDWKKIGDFVGPLQSPILEFPMRDPAENMASEPSPVITTSRLRKSYGNEKALDDVSIKVYKGETLALIGTSGSGKTTLLKSVNGLVPYDSGEIRVHNKALDQWDLVALRRQIGYVIQEVGLFPHYTIEKNIRLVPELLGWGSDRIDQRVDELLEKIHIPPEMKDRYPDALSGGQQQRIGLARALAADPDIVLMDEPFGALDPIIRSGMQQEFLHLEGLAGKTILLVTHDMLEAAILADRLCLMDKGSVQQEGTLKDLLFSPANPFVEQFLDPHRDELEMRAVKMSDLLPFLPGDLKSSLVESDRSLADAEPEISSDLRKSFYLHRDDILKNMRSDE